MTDKLRQQFAWQNELAQLYLRFLKVLSFWCWGGNLCAKEQDIQ